MDSAQTKIAPLGCLGGSNACCFSAVSTIATRTLALLHDGLQSYRPSVRMQSQQEARHASCCSLPVHTSSSIACQAPPQDAGQVEDRILAFVLLFKGTVFAM
jgi:hypothetical protein